MGFTLTQYTSDEEICSQIRSLYPMEEQWNIDFMNLLSQAVERGDYFLLKIKKRKFKIDKLTGMVSEVE